MRSACQFRLDIKYDTNQLVMIFVAAGHGVVALENFAAAQGKAGTAGKLCRVMEDCSAEDCL